MSSPNTLPVFAESVEATAMALGDPNRCAVEICISRADLEARNWKVGARLRKLVISSSCRPPMRLKRIRIDTIRYTSVMRVYHNDGSQFAEEMAVVELVGKFELGLSMWGLHGQ